MSIERVAHGGNAGARGEATPEVSEFARKTSALLDRTEYRRCDKGEDLENIYRLRYKSYRLSNMVTDIPEQAIHDKLDDLQNCYKFGIYIDGDLVSTLRIHHVSLKEPTSPSTMVYGDILRPMLASGASFTDCSRFAVDPEWSRIYPQIPYLTIRLAGIACSHFRAPYGLSTIREEHAGFYRRIFCSEKIGETRDYPGLNYPVVLYRSTVSAIRERSFTRFPFFKWTPMEPRMLFDEPGIGELPPLTVLPTARYFREAA